ncbi:MAG: 2Fe-2S iron-sulfur cluster-binding protein [Syntrophobacteraceae bacterium]
MMARLPESPTQRITRDREVLFYYRGKPMKGLAGDTIATALYANGVRIFSRSMKYHRPRGLYNLDGLSSHCLMTVDGDPNVRACRTPLRDGMAVAPQNVLGTPEWDLLSVMQYLSFAMPAGFYYKVFHKPAWLWPYAQEVIRRAAGLGRIDPDKPDAIYENRFLNGEVCVIGGGPAGMEAALAAAKGGVRVILIEMDAHLGGSLDYRLVPVGPAVPAYRYAARLAEEVEACENIQVLLNTAATAIYQSNQVTAVQQGGPADHFRETYLEIRARSVVVATGATERPLLFENNDLPGIMQAGCAHQLIHTYGLKPGNRAVLSGAHDGMLELACDLASAGVEVAAVADARSSGFDEALAARVRQLSIPFYSGYAVSRAHGFRTVKGVTLKPLAPGKEGLRLSADLLVASAGEAPLAQLLQVAGARMAYSAASAKFLPARLPAAVHAAGRVLGVENVSSILAQGRVAGLAALRDAGVDVENALSEAKDVAASLPGPPAGLDRLKPHPGNRKCFVCFDEDVTVDQIGGAMVEGYDQVELVKRYTTVGTGPSQSYLSGVNLPLLVAENKGLAPGDVMPTTVRPPVVPTRLAALAGRRHGSSKRTPLHDGQKALGGTLKLAGVWERARYFSDETARAEVERVRKRVGFIDVSTLGKFILKGPDSLRLLNRVYVGNLSRVREGRLTYSAMCNEQGIIIDDGVVTKIGEDEYYFTTSSLRAGSTSEWLSFHGKEESWNATLVNLTDALAAINLAGPRSREVLAKLADGDCGNEAFPYMGFRRMKLCGTVDAYVMRVGFVGELSFEIHLPASYGAALQEALLDAGKEFGIGPFGLEAQSVLRLEKGHVILGTDTDNHSTLHDIGLGWAWDRTKTDAGTVGAPALRFTESQAHRQKLVAFIMESPSETPSDGSIIVARGSVKGRVTSSRYSEVLGQSIGLALVDPDLAVMGAPLDFYTDGRLVGKTRDVPEGGTVRGTIVRAPFYDPEGACLKC